ncbi:MAG: phosphoribosylformylglycinamidine cyclo-ligase [Bacteroidota bacterium]|nr:phosphoribosylformylglycinamidine cyclo-ligase [Bacteroidota bacterium]MDP4228944.1 phosphoribosylformylglycinamidine cyclo-ligase [Bacteroidota bacterium]MDP4235971.1 phosphoribosylformylglycinamidine cyclo-ligase [Bacteroidota bacterium]
MIATEKPTKMITYESAGVNIEAGEEVVRRIKPLVRKTFNPNVLTDIGGFGGLYDARFPGMKQPVLVSSTDGVGTKIKVAIDAGKFDSVGHDLVNHCTNDILVCGAKPIFFLDYFASGKLHVEHGVSVVEGFVSGCLENNCALIGGETAEMPGIYAGDDFDLAGTIIGVVERDAIVSRENVREGDVLIGLRSNGLHTNGYSLARKALVEVLGVGAKPKELNGETIGEALLKVHRSYLAPVLSLFEKFSPREDIHSLSHITGGGIVGNTSRVLSAGLGLDIDWNSWKRPAIFDLIQKVGNVPEESMRKALNLGIGLIIIADASKATDMIDHLHASGEEPVLMGKVVKR